MKNKFFNSLCFILIIAIILNLCRSYQILIVEAKTNMKETVIIIDPGHGGEDGGAVAFDGTKEKDINLSIALILRDLFEITGFEVIMTRENDTDLSDKSLSTVAERKKSDILKRNEIINGSEADLVISIHQNFFEEEKYAGAQMFYGKSEGSMALAQFIQDEIKLKLQPQNNREIKKGNGIYILEHSSLPIVLAECGFISNKEELKLLKDKDYIKGLSFIIFIGVCKYLDSVS